MRHLLLVVASLVVALAPAGAAGAGDAGYSNPNPTLTATVGPGFGISLKDGAGAAVTHLEAGVYDVVVNDLSEEHNFHLQGPGVNESTEVAFIGQKTWTVTLNDGTYTFVCDAHSTSMHGSFTVGSGTPPPPSKTPAPKLVGTVGPGFSISLKRSGVAVKTLKAGRFDVTVRDRSADHNFHLVGPGVNRRTGVAYKGTVVWKVTLRTGTLRFLCDPHAKKLRGSVKVI
jgi:hypothetical protein